MSHTNFTTDKPVNEQSKDSAFDSVFSIIKFLITLAVIIGTQIWVNYVHRKKDKKEEKERLEKAERDKIADIIDKEYNKIVEDGIDENLSKYKAKFEAIVIFYGDKKKIVETDGIDENLEVTIMVPGSEEETGGCIAERNKETSAKQGNYKITGLDVIRFMLRNANDFGGESLKKLQKDLDAVVRLFQSLRIKLPLKGDCPINIKEELGPLITDVGEIARSFVSGKKRYTIANVLKYFGNVQEEVRSIEDEEREDDDDNRKVRRILPYVNDLSFPGTSLNWSPYHENDFSFAIFTPLGSQEQNDIISDLVCIRYKLCNIGKTIKVEDLRRFAGQIDAILRRKFQQLPMPDWSNNIRANILHAVYVFMFKIKEGNDIIQDEEFKELVGEMKNITYVQDSEVQKMKSDTAIGGLQRSINTLKSSGHRYLREQKPIADVLQQVEKDLNAEIVQAMKNQNK